MEGRRIDRVSMVAEPLEEVGDHDE